jgi:ribosome-binding protein aMBF1 (putative translation factor)
VAKPLSHIMDEGGISLRDLIASSGLPKDVVRAIVGGQYTPSPTQRQRLASALGVSTDEISWGHAVAVQHLRGNGPQCGRST